MSEISRRLTIMGLLVGGMLAAVPVSAQQFTMKLSQPTINDATHEYFKRLKAGIEQRSGGKMKVDIYPANQLGQLPAVVEGVALGTIEAAASANGFWISLEPRFQVLDAPGLFDDILHGYKVLNDPGIRERMATWGADKGVEVLAPSLYSPLMLLSHKGVRTVADFQGQKIRTQGARRSRSNRSRRLVSFPCRCRSARHCRLCKTRPSMEWSARRRPTLRSSTTTSPSR